jgi:protein involved in polysaccharide export with SLBB domain
MVLVAPDRTPFRFSARRSVAPASHPTRQAPDRGPAGRREAGRFIVALALSAAAWLSGTASAQTGLAVTRLQPAEAASTPAAEVTRSVTVETSRSPRPNPPQDAAPPPPPPPPQEPSEFERLATEANGGRPVWRLGSRTQRAVGSLGQLEIPARVPPQYVVQVGDEVTVTVWGSVDAQWQLRVDRAGRLTLPRAGPVAVAGAKAGDLTELLRKRVSQVFKAFELAAAVTEVSPVRIHITGFVQRPGDFVVPGLTTISAAVALAQGPSAGGSFRRIRLLRDDATVVVFDLYTLLAQGSRQDDRVLQPGDVLHIEASGPQVAVLGSVNRAAVFEFLPGETVQEVLRLAGGFTSVADRGTVVIERLQDRNGLGATELSLPRDGATALIDGDLLRVKSQVAAGVSSQLRNKRVLIEGEVRRPGEYLLPAQSTLADAVEAAGGATPVAFLFGTSLRRESVRVTQETNYDRALRELEVELARSSATRPVREAGSADADASARQLLARLRARRPEGRVVLDLTPQSTQLPALELQDGDQLLLPPSHQSVGVFGSVYNPGSFVHDPGHKLGSYIGRAGGPTEGADYPAAFVVRANGSVLSARQNGTWLARTSSFESESALPGDTVFVPEDLFRGNFVQGAKDWTQILYQLGVGLAALRTLR